MFLEGSIANNKYVFPRIISELIKRANNKEFFSTINVPQPQLSPNILTSLKALYKVTMGEPFSDSKELSAQILHQVDNSLIGAAAAIIADNILSKT